jgi:hypothetical protein
VEQRLLSLLDGVRGVYVISEVVEREIELAPPNEAAAIHRHIERVQPVTYPVGVEVQALARAYSAAGVLTERREADAAHVALLLPRGTGWTFW